MYMSVIHKQDKITTIQHINIKNPKAKMSKFEEVLFMKRSKNQNVAPQQKVIA